MLNKEVKAVLFDLDGVLVDSFDAWFNTYNDSLLQLGYSKVSKQKFKEIFGSPIEEDVRTSFKGQSISAVKNEYVMNFRRRVRLVRLIHGARETLISLRKKSVRLALITNSPKTIVSLILSHHKIRKYFHTLVAMEDVKIGKPAPDMALEACKRLGVRPENSILVGDTKYDMIAGKKAGCIAVGYKLKGDYKIDSLKQIERFIYV